LINYVKRDRLLLQLIKLNKNPRRMKLSGVDAGTEVTEAVATIAEGNNVLTLEVLTAPGVIDTPTIEIGTPPSVITSSIICTVADCVAPTTILVALVASVNIAGTAAGIPKAELLALSSLMDILSVTKSLKNCSVPILKL